MFIACIVGGLVLIASGAMLSRLRPPDWSSDGELSDEHRRPLIRWGRFQRILRLANNALVSIIGGAIVGSAFIPRGRAWGIAWCVILALVLLTIVLAMIDAFSSLAGYRRALPEAARRSMIDRPLLQSKQMPPTSLDPQRLASAQTLGKPASGDGDPR